MIRDRLGGPKPHGFDPPKSHIPIIPFLRTWPMSEILFQTTLDSLLPCGNFLLQLFEPVQHDIDLRGRRLRLLDGLDHEEALAVS
jgi:hypothetical protein